MLGKRRLECIPRGHFYEFEAAAKTPHRHASARIDGSGSGRVFID